jgi:hypothetical protein
MKNLENPEITEAIAAADPATIELHCKGGYATDPAGLFIERGRWYLENGKWSVYPDDATYWFVRPGSGVDDITDHDAITSEFRATINARIAAAAAAEKIVAEREARIKALPGEPAAFAAPTVQADGSLLYMIPDPPNEGKWSKKLDSVDLGVQNGMAFEGPWLKVGRPSVLTAGDIVVVGAKWWEGSRSGGYKKSRTLYVACSAGLVALADNSPNAATLLLQQAASERQETALKEALDHSNAKIETLNTAADDPANADLADDIASRQAGWVERGEAICAAIAALAAGRRPRRVSRAVGSQTLSKKRGKCWRCPCPRREENNA